MYYPEKIRCSRFDESNQNGQRKSKSMKTLQEKKKELTLRKERRKLK
jgi:hypothetical protein